MSDTVYLAGPLSDHENPYKWHEEVQSISYWTGINPFINQIDGESGMEIYEKDLELIKNSDALLLHRTDFTEICGAYIESGYAHAHGIPTVVHNDSDSEVPKFPRWHSKSIESDLGKAIKAVNDCL